mgnify:CR=1 FL=1
MVNTLAKIIQLVRDLVQTPTEFDLTENYIKENINTFMRGDFSTKLKLYKLHMPFVFYTIPNVGEYKKGTTPELADWDNVYPSTNQPAFAGGYRMSWSQDRGAFFASWPFINQIQNIGTGDGSETDYSGTSRAYPVLQGNVSFSAVGTDQSNMVLIDHPIDRENGNLWPAGTEPTSTVSPYGTINYLTGEYGIKFIGPVADQMPIIASYVPYQPSRPISLLYYNNTFTLRPVPDKSYPINIEVYMQPTDLIESGQHPEIDQWSELIAYGAAIKICQRRGDTDTENAITPEFNQQMRNVKDSTGMQAGNVRTPTIFSQSPGIIYYGNYPFGNGGY